MLRRIRTCAALAGAAVLVACLFPAGGAARTIAETATPSPSLPALPSEAAARNRWMIGVKCDYPPFGYIDVRAAKVGFEVAIARRFAQLAFGDDGRVDLVCVTTASREPTLRAGQVDMLISTYAWTLARAQQFDFSQPYYASPGRLAVRKSSSVASLADLAQKTIVTTRGSIYAGWTANCKPTSTIAEVEGVGAALTTLKEGRADAFMWDEAVLVSVAATNPDLRLTQDSFLSIPWGIAVRKGEAATLRWVNAAIKLMTAKDEFFSLFGRYLPPGVSVGDVPRPGRPQIQYIGNRDPRTDCTVITLPPRATAAVRPRQPKQPTAPKKSPTVERLTARTSVRALRACPVCGFEATFVFSAAPPRGARLTAVWFYNGKYQGEIAKKLARRVSSYIKWAGPAPRGYYWCDLMLTKPGKSPVRVARAVTRR